MPYHDRKDLPDNVRNVLPAHAQDIFMEAFNSALDTYADPKSRRGEESQEETAFRVAWAAVKHKYEKGDDDKWHVKK